MTEQPIKNCYWVVPGQFLAGEYPRDKEALPVQPKIESLLAAGVAAFIDLTEEGELSPYTAYLDDVTHQRFPIRDLSVPDSREKTSAILKAIDDHLAAGRLVYVHCWGGVGRTGTIVGCWLKRHGYPGPAALDRLQTLWQHCPKAADRPSPETAAQVRYILDWTEAR